MVPGQAITILYRSCCPPGDHRKNVVVLRSGHVSELHVTDKCMGDTLDPKLGGWWCDDGGECKFFVRGKILEVRKQSQPHT